MEGLHAAGSFNRDSRLLVAAKDATRHNAVDKGTSNRFLAWCLPDAHTILQVSGWVSVENLQKAAAAEFPAVSAVSAPSGLAVSAADRLGSTLAAIVREDRRNLYAHPRRVIELK